MVSLVIPTFNESPSIEPILRRSAAALENTGESYELIVVDDSSPDGTAEIVQTLSSELPVRLLRREGRLGLASAVVDGWKIARGNLLGVMDADLQHPPEVLSRLVTTLRVSGADIAVASRTGDGGGCQEWSRVRRFTSWCATHLASCVLPLTLADVHDPMSGMFMLKSEILDGITLEPMGYKILLEVLGKAQYEKICEVPYVFGPRDAGTSKLGPRQTVEYFAHLAQLALATGQFGTWLSYAAVGFSGASLHLALLLFFVASHSWSLVLALPMAIQAALLNNFICNRFFTFRRLPGSRAVRGDHLMAGLARYQSVCVPGALLNSLLTLILVRFGFPLLSAACAGVLLGGFWNLFFNVPAIWRSSISRSVGARFASVAKIRRANLS